MHDCVLPISVGVRYSGHYQRECCTRRSHGSTDTQGWIYERFIAVATSLHSACFVLQAVTASRIRARGFPAESRYLCGDG